MKKRVRALIRVDKHWEKKGKLVDSAAGDVISKSLPFKREKKEPDIRAVLRDTRKGREREGRNIRNLTVTGRSSGRGSASSDSCLSSLRVTRKKKELFFDRLR